MKINIEDYINLKYKTRSPVDETRKQFINDIHKEVSERIRFSFPLYHIDSYNINSSIVNLDNNYYHIIDHSTFNYLERFCCAYEYASELSLYSIYLDLKEDNCIYNDDNNELNFYNSQCRIVMEYELYPYFPQALMNKYKMMVRYYFLHEYAHYFKRNPIKITYERDLLDIIVENFFSQMKKRAKSSYEEQMLKKYRHDYYKNDDFREEIECDFQASLCLLELSNTVDVKSIFESILLFLYAQYYILLAKNSHSVIKMGNIFHFRINAILSFAYLLQDDEIACLLAGILNNSNRYNNLTSLKCLDINMDKHNRFYKYYIGLILKDRNRKSL